MVAVLSAVPVVPGQCVICSLFSHIFNIYIYIFIYLYIFSKCLFFYELFYKVFMLFYLNLIYIFFLNVYFSMNCFIKDNTTECIYIQYK